MFGSITDEEIAANAGKTYQDVTAMRDPLAGLTYEEETGEESAPFEEPAADSLTLDGKYIQLPNGKMNGSLPGGGKSGKIKKTKYAPSPRRNPSGISVSAKKYAKLCGTMNTRYPGLEEGQIRRIRDTKREYTVKADGYGGMEILKVDKLR